MIKDVKMIGDVIDLFEEVKEIAEKHNNAEFMKKLTRLYGVITEIQEENERLEKRVYSKLYSFVSPSVGRNLICSNCKRSIR